MGDLLSTCSRSPVARLSLVSKYLISNGIMKRFRLHDIGRSIVHSDIQVYLRPVILQARDILAGGCGCR